MIRKANYDDIPKIEELLEDIHRLHFMSRPDLFKDGISKFNKEEIKALIDSKDKPIYIYEDGGKALGYAFISYMTVKNKMLEEIPYIFVEDLCVDERYRSKGIGRALMDYINNLAKKEGIEYIRLNVWNFNEKALKFYQDNGYSPLETIMERRVK